MEFRDSGDKITKSGVGRITFPRLARITQPIAARIIFPRLARITWPE